MVDSLRFNVAQLLRDPVGASRRAEVELRLGELAPKELGETPGLADATLRGAVRLMHTNAGVLTTGNFRTEIVETCARCLEPVTVPLETDVEEVFAPTVDILTGKSITPDEEDQALWIDEHHVLDLSEVLRQDVLIAIPITTLCREDCRGLCPRCGQNLNAGTCTCEPEPDPRWGPLLNLLEQAN